MLINLCFQREKLRGFGGSAPKDLRATVGREKSQLAHRMEGALLREILESFNAGQMDAACERLQIGRAHLYRLRTEWLKDRNAFAPQLSGGNHKELWPHDITDFLQKIVPLSKPLNYAFITDQLVS